MKVGLLICDHVRSEWQEAHGDYPEMFQEYLPECIWEYYEVTKGQLPASIDACDAYICTGSRHSVYEDLSWIEDLSNFIQSLHRQKKKYVGVCFGHQMIGKALGGHVQPSPQGWCVGIHEFKIEAYQNWMEPSVEKKIKVLMMCQDQIMTLPSGAVRLATSAHCPNAMIQIENHILGIQGHPEFSIEYEKTLIEARKNLIGIEKANQALKTLSINPDRELLQSWIMHFINYTSLRHQ